MKTNDQDIRWLQRLSNFNKAFHQLKSFIDQNQLNEMEEQGLIKSFEYTYELSWKTLQDLLKYKGYQGIVGLKPVIEQSFQDGYISDGKAWMKMHQSRNMTSLTYDQKTAGKIAKNIKFDYFKLFQNLQVQLNKEKSKTKPNETDE